MKVSPWFFCNPTTRNHHSRTFKSKINCPYLKRFRYLVSLKNWSHECALLSLLENGTVTWKLPWSFARVVLDAASMGIRRLLSDAEKWTRVKDCPHSTKYVEINNSNLVHSKLLESRSLELTRINLLVYQSNNWFAATQTILYSQRFTRAGDFDLPVQDSFARHLPQIRSSSRMSAVWNSFDCLRRIVDLRGSRLPSLFLS